MLNQKNVAVTLYQNSISVRISVLADEKNICLLDAVLQLHFCDYSQKLIDVNPAIASNGLRNLKKWHQIQVWHHQLRFSNKKKLFQEYQLHLLKSYKVQDIAGGNLKRVCFFLNFLIVVFFFSTLANNFFFTYAFFDVVKCRVVKAIE